MKKIILILSILIISFIWINNTFAEDAPWDSNVVEIVISADFSPVLPWICYTENSDGEYICAVPKWVTWFQIVMWWFIKYLTFIASLAWVLFIVVNWILYSMSWMEDSMKTDAKNRIMKTLMWIIVLLLSWVILHLIAPWVYR